MAFQVIEGGPGDFAEIDALRAAIEWPAGTWFFGAVLESGGTVPLVRDGEGMLIGMGLGAAFGQGGFVGNMVVHPEHRRRGIGAAVFENLLGWFKERGVTAIQLEATPDGQPLYERYGFRPTWESMSGVCVRVPAADLAADVGRILPEEWPQVAALAERAYGEQRGPFLRVLAAAPDTTEIAVLRERGRVTAFAVRRPGRLGPFCAEDESGAETLARVLLNRAGEGTRVPVGHPCHAVFWERLGIEVEPYDVRMARGEPAGDPRLLYAMLNGGVG